MPAGRELAWPIAARDVVALGLDRPDPARVYDLLALLELASLAERPADAKSATHTAPDAIPAPKRTRPTLSTAQRESTRIAIQRRRPDR